MFNLIAKEAVSLTKVWLLAAFAYIGHALAFVLFVLTATSAAVFVLLAFWLFYAIEELTEVKQDAVEQLRS